MSSVNQIPDFTRDKRYVSTAESDLGMQTLRVPFVIIRAHFYVVARVALPDATASFAFVDSRMEKEDPEKHPCILSREMLP